MTSFSSFCRESGWIFLLFFVALSFHLGFMNHDPMNKIFRCKVFVTGTNKRNAAARKTNNQIKPKNNDPAIERKKRGVKKKKKRH